VIKMDYNCTEETNWECYSRKRDSNYALPNGDLAPHSVASAPLSLERKLIGNGDSLYHDSLTERIDY
jgi:hypothetical protein